MDDADVTSGARSSSVLFSLPHGIARSGMGTEGLLLSFFIQFFDDEVTLAIFSLELSVLFFFAFK